MHTTITPKFILNRNSFNTESLVSGENNADYWKNVKKGSIEKQKE